ncbi:hypothetical protein HDU96_009245 [Phlyctochytrium bullatum]|nr:hypothetical protein HDU96_009245 [Phlyctochytrium bullatum]
MGPHPVPPHPPPHTTPLTPIHPLHPSATTTPVSQLLPRLDSPVVAPPRAAPETALAARITDLDRDLGPPSGPARDLGNPKGEACGAVERGTGFLTLLDSARSLRPRLEREAELASETGEDAEKQEEPAVEDVEDGVPAGEVIFALVSWDATIIYYRMVA